MEKMEKLNIFVSICEDFIRKKTRKKYEEQYTTYSKLTIIRFSYDYTVRYI